MCGIAGIFNLDGAPVSEEQLGVMARSIQHRGPDDGGFAMINSGENRGSQAGGRSGGSDCDLGLVNRRLAIIDLTPSGHQPMAFGRLTIVYNGEIYNHVEIGEELKSLGRTFRSRSDTEVLLQAYDEWGPECVRRLNGIFAFALWDGDRRKLFCARDRLGVKPFYYEATGKRLLLCSEIRGLLALHGGRCALNRALVYDHLTSGWLDHTDETFFEGILKLPAGASMTVSREGTRIDRYWELRAEPAPEQNCEANVAQFDQLFRDSIRLQMRSDVTVACCLSGGLDSSAVVSLAAPQSPHRMRTYTARFQDPRMDEWEYAQAIHERQRVEPTAVLARPEEFWDSLPQLVWDQEEPFGGPGVFAQWNLMRQIHRDGIKVVLDGQGGDELLCGYGKYFYLSVLELLRKGSIPEAAAALLAGVARGGNHLFNTSAARRYLPSGWWLDGHRDRLLEPCFVAEFCGRQSIRWAGDVRTQQALDVNQVSLPVLLRYEDKNAMAHSIESRVPFLDHRLVEFALGLPTRDKIRKSESKYVMRRALAGEMPEMVLKRKTKLGFGGYFESWIDALSPQIQGWMDRESRPVDQFVLPSGVRRLFERRDRNLFKVLILDHWMERFGFV